MAYKKRVDGNQPEIVAELRELGLSVLHLHAVGGGVMDIACGYGGISALCEIKKGKGRFTEAQKKLMKKWTGGMFVLRTKEDCLKLKEALVRWHRKINAPDYCMDDYPDNRKDA